MKKITLLLSMCAFFLCFTFVNSVIASQSCTEDSVEVILTKKNGDSKIICLPSSSLIGLERAAENSGLMAYDCPCFTATEIFTTIISLVDSYPYLERHISGTLDFDWISLNYFDQDQNWVVNKWGTGFDEITNEGYCYNVSDFNGTDIKVSPISTDEINTCKLKIQFASTSCGGGSDTPPTTPVWKLPATGQTVSYTNTFGEDSDYIANEMSYTDNGDGTVTDNNTGLMWQQTNDSTERLMDEAETYCADLTLGGHDDWRVPTIKELFSIVHFGDAGLHPGGAYWSFDQSFSSDSFSSNYWAADRYPAPSPQAAWAIHFWSNFIQLFTGGGMNVRCTRGAEPWVSEVLTLNTDGVTISDEKTGLTWQKSSFTPAIPWEDAIQYCEDLTLANKTNWRLPNQKELQSIIDYTQVMPTFYPLFEGSFGSADGYWSSTTDYDNPTSAWTASFYLGNCYSSTKTNLNHVRCVSSVN